MHDAELPPRRTPPIPRPRPSSPRPQRPRTTGSRHAGRPKRRGFARPLLVLALLALFCAAGAYTGRALLRPFRGKDGRPATWGDAMAPPFGGKKKVFLLVLGVDQKNRLLKTDARRADTMILASLDLEHKNVAALSLPRDTRIRIPGRKGFDKLNAAHSLGGPALVRQTVSEYLGIPIDRYIKTDVSGFQAIVDLIGPIELDVEKKMDYDDNWGNLHIHLKPGKQLLNGEKAMEYVRFRHDATGDMGRMKRQQKFLRAVAKKMFALTSLPKLPQVIDQGMKFVETDLSPRELLAVGSLFSEVPASQIATATLPGTPKYIGRVSYYVPDDYEKTAVLKKLFYTTRPILRASVEVLNGNGIPGVATCAARSLKEAGFEVSRTGNAANYQFEKTEVHAGPDHQQEARRAASILGVSATAVIAPAPDDGGDKKAPKTAPGVTIVLGKDYRPQ